MFYNVDKSEFMQFFRDSWKMHYKDMHEYDMVNDTSTMEHMGNHLWDKFNQYGRNLTKFWGSLDDNNAHIVALMADAYRAQQDMFRMEGSI